MPLVVNVISIVVPAPVHVLLIRTPAAPAQGRQQIWRPGIFDCSYSHKREILQEQKYCFILWEAMMAGHGLRPGCQGETYSSATCVACLQQLTTIIKRVGLNQSTAVVCLMAPRDMSLPVIDDNVSQRADACLFQISDQLNKLLLAPISAVKVVQLAR